LKGLTKPRDFSQYFTGEALVNRPARKLFEAWLRKDHTLWPRLYQTIHKEMDLKPEGEDESAEPAASPKAAKDDLAPAPAAVEEMAADPAKAIKAAPVKKVKTAPADAAKAKDKEAKAPAAKKTAKDKAEPPVKAKPGKDVEKKVEKKTTEKKAAAAPKAKSATKAKPDAKSKTKATTKKKG